jgi:hypothetical protein
VNLGAVDGGRAGGYGGVYGCADERHAGEVWAAWVYSLGDRRGADGLDWASPAMENLGNATWDPEYGLRLRIMGMMPGECILLSKVCVPRTRLEWCARSGFIE